MIHTHHFLQQICKATLTVFLLFSYGCSSSSANEDKHQTSVDTEHVAQTTTTVSVPKPTHLNLLQSLLQHQSLLVMAQR